MKTLITTDYSDASKAAIDFAKRMPLAEKPDVNLMHVVVDRDVPARVSMHPGWARVVEALVEGSAKQAEEIIANLETVSASVTSTVKKGHSADEILSVAEADDPDLIIIGAAGHSALTRWFLGSTSDRVATHAECSTLVIRPGEDADPSCFRAVLAFDGSKRAADAVAEVTNALSPSEAKITLVSVVAEVGTVAIEFAEAATEAWAEARDEAREALDSKAAELSKAGFDVETVLASAEHVGHELCTQAEKAKADLIAVGDQGHDAMARFVLGSVSRYVLRHAKTSVWIARPS